MIHAQEKWVGMYMVSLKCKDCAHKDGMVYVIRINDAAKSESRLTRVDTKTGQIIPWPGAIKAHVYPIIGPEASSMAALGDKLYVANSVTNKLSVLDISDGKVVKALDVPAPKKICGDAKNNLLWVISNNSLIAVDADGKKITESKAVPDPATLDVAAGKLAVASHKTGKVHYFDTADPTHLKPIGEFGKGDGPYGKFETDRFYFQKAPGWSPKSDDLNVDLALNSQGDLAVTDVERRVSVFDKNGKNFWYTFGVFGNMSRPSYSTLNRRLWDPYINTSFLMDEKTGTWEIEALWDFSDLSPKNLKEPYLQQLGDFSADGKAFFVAVSWFTWGGNEVKKDAPMLVVARLEGFKGVPVLAISAEGERLISRKDTNGDGKINANDKAEPVLDAQGKPLTAAVFSRFDDLQPDGSITVMGRPGFIWKRTGLDANGVPVYEGKNYVPLPNKDWEKDISPYDYKLDPVQGWVQCGFLSNGGYVAQTIMRSSGGSGLNNGAGTDLCGYTPDGRLRWVNQMALYKGIAGMGTADDITITTIFYSMDVLAFDSDGLALGAFCEAPILHYCGYWIDHPNLRFVQNARWPPVYDQWG